MMDASQTIVLSNVPEVVIFRDDTIAGGFYALPKSPRLKTVDDLSTIRLLVLGRRAHGAFEATGGLFACTTTLELTTVEQQTVADAVRSTLPKATAALVQLMPVSWTYGRVSLRAEPILDLHGSPSLIGGNDCVFQAKLPQHEVKELETQWRREGYRLCVSYEVGALGRGSSDFLIEGVLHGSPGDSARLITHIVSP